MAPRSLALLVLGLSLTAHAQSTSPALHGLGGRLALTGRVEASGEHSCSQSFATSRESIGLALDVDARGVATLRVESGFERTFGDASSRFTGGSSSLTQARALRVLSGHATRSSTSLEIRFDHAEDASVRWQGPGVAALPAGTTPTAVSLTMHCALADHAVLPAIESAGEQPSMLPLLRCEFESPPAFLEYDETNEFFFGRGAGVRISTHEGGWDPRRVSVVRLAE